MGINDTIKFKEENLKILLGDNCDWWVGVAKAFTKRKPMKPLSISNLVTWDETPMGGHWWAIRHAAASSKSKFFCSDIHTICRVIIALKGMGTQKRKEINPIELALQFNPDFDLSWADRNVKTELLMADYIPDFHGKYFDQPVLRYMKNLKDKRNDK